MKDGVCPKCGSKDIFTDSNLRVKVTMFGMNQVIAKVGAISNTLAEYNNYLCSQCGYLEQYVESMPERAKLLENWARLEQE